MKIGFNVKMLINNFKETIYYLSTKVIQNENNIANHETRITTLENSSGGGGTARSVFYIYDNYLYKDSELTTKVTANEFDAASTSTILTILNMSEMENFGTYTVLFSKSTVDENGNETIKVLIMQENGVLRAVFTAP